MMINHEILGYPIFRETHFSKHPYQPRGICSPSIALQTPPPKTSEAKLLIPLTSRFGTHIQRPVSKIHLLGAHPVGTLLPEMDSETSQRINESRGGVLNFLDRSSPHQHHDRTASRRPKISINRRNQSKS